MSFPLSVAKEKAAELLQLLKPACEKIDIAGSIRRDKPEVKDIEIVCHPKMALDLFGEPTIISGDLDYKLAELVNAGILQHSVKNGQKYKNFVVPPLGIKLDLFIVTPPAQYGFILTLRTGPGGFSQKIVTRRNKGGLLPSHLKVKDGAIWDGNNVVPTPTEAAFFNLLEIDWIEPKQR